MDAKNGPKEYHYTKRIYNVDIKQILTDNSVPTCDAWDTKEPEITQDFIWEHDRQR